MACFTVPAAGAVVTYLASKKGKSAGAAKSQLTSTGHFSLATKLSWLIAMLAGGSALLAIEHIWHGEVVFYPPFLTAMTDAAETAIMWQEISTVGVAMLGIVLLAWVAICALADHVKAIKSAVATDVIASAAKQSV